MHINCIICSDLISPSDEVFSTTCGHMFHYLCLEQWIARSKTCPQCRHKVSDKSIHRVYFNIPNSEGVDEDAIVLQSKLDSMSFQLKVKETDIKNLKDKYKTVKSQSEGQRDFIKLLEEKARTTESTIFALKEQIQYFKEKSKESDRLHGELQHLKNRMRVAEDLELAINGSMDEVRNMMANNFNVESLCIMNCTLKQQLIDTDRKSKQLNLKLMKMKSEVNDCKRQNENLKSDIAQKNSELEEHLSCNKQRLYLKDKISKLQKQLEDGNQSPNNSIRRILTESPAPAQVSFNDAVLDIEVDSPTIAERVQAIKDSDSPYLRTTKNSASTLNLLNAKFSTTFIKSSKPAIKPTETTGIAKYSLLRDCPTVRPSSSSDLNYNGLGGHSKDETFPSPKASRTITLKRPKSSIGLPSSKFRKLSAQTKKLDGYFKSGNL